VPYAARAYAAMPWEMIMRHVIRVRPLKLLALTIAALGILVATSVSFATRPIPQTRILDDRLDHIASPIDVVAAAPTSGGPSAFGFLEFDWNDASAVPGFAPWRDEAASSRTAEIVPTR
jgi:hypothetical protein